MAKELCRRCHKIIKEEGGVSSVNGYCADCVVELFISMEDTNERLGIKNRAQTLKINEQDRLILALQGKIRTLTSSGAGLLLERAQEKLAAAEEVIRVVKDANQLNYELFLAKQDGGVNGTDIDLLKSRRSRATTVSQKLARGYFLRFFGPSTANQISDVTKYDQSSTNSSTN